MKIEGRCHCGHVSYEAEIDPDRVGICHCTDCQALTGSAYRVTVLAARDKVRMTGQPPKLYTKTGENGRRRLQYFCPERGSSIYATGVGVDAGEWLRWGGICQRRELSPKRQIWCRSAAPWVGDLRTLPGRAAD